MEMRALVLEMLARPGLGTPCRSCRGLWVHEHMIAYGKMADAASRLRCEQPGHASCIMICFVMVMPDWARARQHTVLARAAEAGPAGHDGAPHTHASQVFLHEKVVSWFGCHGGLKRLAVLLPYLRPVGREYTS